MFHTIHVGRPEPSGTFDYVVTADGASQTTSVILDGAIVDVDIDWGDGDSDNYTTAGTKSHTYTNAGTYTVKATGEAEEYSFDNLADNDRITYVLTSLGNAISGINYVSFMFRGCAGLTTIPSDLFSGVAADSLATYTFFGCTALTTVPAGLLDPFTQTLDMKYFFNSCSAITSLPSGLLDNCTSLNNVIRFCTGCSSLTSIPTDLLGNCPDVTSVEYMFDNCTSLSFALSADFFGGTAVTELDYFLRNTDVTSIASDTFDAFENNINNVTRAFSGCSSLTGNAYPFWDWTTEPGVKTDCYAGATGLDDYATIPAAYL